MLTHQEVRNLARNYTALVVEDDPTSAQIIQELLARFFKKVDVAPDAEKGLNAYVTEGGYDVLVIDVYLPAMNGMELSRIFKAVHEEEQVVIVYSAQPDSKLLIEAVNMGINGFFVKPANQQEMLSAIYNACRHLADRHKN